MKGFLYLAGGITLAGLIGGALGMVLPPIAAIPLSFVIGLVLGFVSMGRAIEEWGL